MPSLHRVRACFMASILALFFWTGQAAPAAYAQESLMDLPLHDMTAFRPTGDNWQIAGDVFADFNRRHHLDVETGTGVLVSLPSEDARENIFTTWEHGDLTLALDFMMPSASNSGIYLQGRYEVQLFDSWGMKDPTFADVGGVYQRWDETRRDSRKGFDGVPPRMNAGRAPGLWQHLEIDFRAPRFDRNGRKVENARFERIELNGVVIHENVELTGPTRAAGFDAETPAGPLMIQGDHGPVALRDIQYKRYGRQSVRLSDVTYRTFEGEFDSLPDLEPLVPVLQGALDGFRHDVVGDLDRFAIVFEGELAIPTTGPYFFDLGLGWIDDDPHFEGDPQGGGLVRVGDHDAVRHEGTSPSAEGTVHLQAGRHPFRVAYFKNQSGRAPVALLTVEGPDTRRRLLNVDTSLPSPPLVGPIHLDYGTHPLLHRHMVGYDEDRRTHVMSVGDPGGVHYTVDLHRGALLQVWRGPFLDATPMWHSRGYHQLALPRGSVARMAGAPELIEAPEGSVTFERYVLDDAGRPVFQYAAQGVEITDRIEPDAENRILRRTLRADGGELRHAVARTAQIERLPDGSYAIDDRSYLIRFDGPAAPVIQPLGEGYELLVPLSDGPVTYSIIW